VITRVVALDTDSFSSIELFRIRKASMKWIFFWGETGLYTLIINKMGLGLVLHQWLGMNLM
jgi:hypothetical protein